MKQILCWRHTPLIPLPCLNLEGTKKSSAVSLRLRRSLKRNRIIAYAVLSACLAATLSGVSNRTASLRYFCAPMALAGVFTVFRL